MNLKVNNLLFGGLFLGTLNAQLIVDQTYTPTQLVQNVLLGTGVQAFNITFSGDVCQRGYFNAANTLLGTTYGMNEGVILASGCIQNAVGPNNSGSAGNSIWGPGDPDLEALINNTVPTFDAAILEFDFIATGDTVRFEYVFGSEEYEEWVNSSFNDVFGFFLSGPGINGPYSNNSINIALIPGTTTPVAINTVNYSSNTQYYVNNTCCSFSPCSGGQGNCASNPQYIQYDGHTVKLVAQYYPLVCGQTYHIKIAIADAGDGVYDSGVFLKKGSFKASGLVLSSMVINSQDSVSLYEGCASANLIFNPTDTSVSTTIYISTYGTPIEGIDYSPIPDTFVIPPGTSSSSIPVSAIQDGVIEGNETLYIVIKQFICNTSLLDTLMLIIKDSSSLTVSTSPDTTICTCAALNVSAYPQGGVLPYSYQWSNGYTTQSFTITACNAQTFYVTVTDNCGYKGIDSVKILFVSGTPVTFSLPDSINASCGNNQVVLSVSNVSGGSPPYSYSWSNGATTQSITVSVSQTTIYYVSVSDGCGYTATDSVKILFSSGSPVTFSLPDTLSASCGNNQVILSVSNVSGGSPPYSYSWSNGSTTQSTTVSVSQTTVYYVSVSDFCNPSNPTVDSVIVKLGGFPQASFSSTNACPGIPVVFSNSSTNATSYLWYFGDGSSSTAQNPSHPYALSGLYYVTLIALAGPNCSDTTISVVTIHPTPQVSFSTSNVCEGMLTNFTNNSTITQGSIQSYQWYFGDGSSSSAQNPVHQYTSWGTYNVTLIAISDSGCSSQLSKQVQVYPLPNASFQSPSEKCINEAPVDFTANSTIPSGIITQHIWFFGDGSSTTGNNVSHIYQDTGVYTVTLIASSSYGCVDTFEKSIYIKAAPLAEYTSPNPSGCPPHCATLINTSAPGASYASISQTFWQVEGYSSTAMDSATFCFNQSGFYSPLIIVTNSLGCSDTFQINNYIQIYPVPDAFFVIDTPQVDILSPTINVYDASVGATSWQFYVDDSLITSPSFTYTFNYEDTGLHIIQLITKNLYGCIDTFTREVNVIPLPFLYFPNAFTPNNDQINDEFIWRGIGIREDKYYFFAIYDRWGQLIWSTNKLGEAWDGTIKKDNKVAPEGVYVYKFRCRDISGKIWNLSGTVTLMR